MPYKYSYTKYDSRTVQNYSLVPSYTEHVNFVYRSSKMQLRCCKYAMKAVLAKLYYVLYCKNGRLRS